MKCKGKCIPRTLFLPLARGQMMHWASGGGGSCVLENRSRIPWAWVRKWEAGQRGSVRTVIGTFWLEMSDCEVEGQRRWILKKRIEA